MKVAKVDCNVQTIDWILNTPEIENSSESDMDVNLSSVVGRDSSHYSAEVPDMPESDLADADLSFELAPDSLVCHTDSVPAVSTPDSACASVVSHPDSVLAGSMPDSVPVSVAPGIAPASVTVTHSPNSD